jgi:hypothetical protein
VAGEVPGRICCLTASGHSRWGRIPCQACLSVRLMSRDYLGCFLTFSILHENKTNSAHESSGLIVCMTVDSNRRPFRNGIETRELWHSFETSSSKYALRLQLYVQVVLPIVNSDVTSLSSSCRPMQYGLRVASRAGLMATLLRWAPMQVRSIGTAPRPR